MKEEKNIKTNAIRLLDKAKLPYEVLYYDVSKGIDGKSVAQNLKIDENILFKTLVTQGKSGSYFVFVIPVSSELNLKKAAKVAKEKFIELIPQKDLLSLTGYIHGGCSPLSMKKQFKTFFHNSASNFENILFNGGKAGIQIKCNIKDISNILPLEMADLI